MEVTNRNIVLSIFAVALIGGVVVGWTFLNHQQKKHRQLQTRAASLMKPSLPNPTINSASPRLHQANSPSESQAQLLQNFRDLLRQKDALLQKQTAQIVKLTQDRKRLSELIALSLNDSGDGAKSKAAELAEAEADWQQRFSNLLALNGLQDEQKTDEENEGVSEMDALEALAGQIETLREELATATEEMATQRTLAELEIEILRSSIRDVAVETGAAVVDGLVDKLDDDTPVVRKWAAELLGEIGTAAEDAVGPLTSLLDDANEQVRTAARAALEKINP